MNARRMWFGIALTSALLAGCDDAPPPDVDAGGEDAGSPDGGSTPECPSGTALCSDACVDTDNDRRHCGACDVACATGEACIDGACGIVCPASQTECDGACADPTNDRRHCGACGTACADGEICVDSTCEVSCPSGQTVCGAACVSTESDPAHCGGCDSPCASGEVCSAGTCAGSCGTLTDCSGACVDTANDPAHCGGCDAACPAASAASGLCMAGTCRLVCDALMGDCNADLGAATGDGCETPLATDAANCGACGRTCTIPNAVAGCAAGACAIATCDAGWDDCDGRIDNGCESDVSADDFNCGACGTVCPTGESCVDSSCRVVVGDTCGSAVALAAGPNSIAWTAFGADYITASPSCASGYAPVGPDLVLTYTAPVDQEVRLEFTKPTSTRWAAVVSTEACGTLSPSIACISDWSPATMSGSFTLAASQTAYIYVVDTTSGTLPLDNPLNVNVTASDCSLPPSATFAPAHGATTTTTSPSFVATFAGVVDPTMGVITLTGTMGTSLSYDLSTSPAQVTFTSSNSVMTIDPGIAFPPGEVVTISWTGLRGSPCTGGTPMAIPPPAWVVNIVAPSCVPGAGGVVGRTTATMVTGRATFTEYYVAADASATGYVYAGGTADLFRIPKAGGAVEDVEALAGLTSAQLGYAMVIDGLDIFTVENLITGTSGRLFRISSDGGATWSVQDYATFTTSPNDDFASATVYAGRIYLATHDSAATEIWSVPTGAATLPAAATLEMTVTGETSCSGIARDASFYYLACSGGDRLVRVPAAGGTPVLITDTFDMSATANALYGHDLDADGVFDVLYLQTWYEEVYYVCSPAGATPYVDVLVDVGGTSSNYGMGFDRSGAVLWMIDDDNREFISIQ